MFNSIRTVGRQPPAVLVIGVFNDKKLDRAAKDADADGAISRALGRAECTGEAGKLCEA